MKLKVNCAEDRLVRLCARPHFYEDSAFQIRGIASQPLNWNYVLKKSQKEGVSLLIYRHLEALQLTDRIPKYILESWQMMYYSNSARNILILAEAEKVLNLLNQEKIKAIVLKGIFLAEHIYKNISLRPMSDVDILINRADLTRVNIILGSLGYIHPPNYTDSLKQDSSFSASNSLAYYKNNISAFFMHVHWHLINSSWPLDYLVSKIDMNRIWSLALPVKINGINTLTLSAEHQLLYLSHHSFNHSLARLILFSDILEFLTCHRDKIDWRLVIREAQRFKLSHILYYALLLSSRRFRYDMPELKRIKPSDNSWPEKALSFLLDKEIGLSIAAYTAYLLLQDGLSDKIRFIKRTILPQASVMAQNLNMPISKINASHYYRRIVNNLAHCFSAKLY